MASNVVTRFLTDEDVPVSWAHAINKIAAVEEMGLHCEAISIHDIGRSGLVDKEQLIFARENGFVLMTCDQYRHQDGQALRAELLTNGGKIIQLRGGPEQPAHQAVAKILMHFSAWREKFSMENGVATFQAANAFRFRNPSRFAHNMSQTGEEQLIEYESRPDEPRQITRNVDLPDDQGKLI